MCICYWSPFGFHSIKSSFDFLQWFCWIVGYCSENQMLHMNWIHKLVWILRFVVVVVRRREVFGFFFGWIYWFAWQNKLCVVSVEERYHFHRITIPQKWIYRQRKIDLLIWKMPLSNDGLALVNNMREKSLIESIKACNNN